MPELAASLAGLMSEMQLEGLGAEALEIGRVFADSRLATDIDSFAYAAAQAATRLGQADSLSGYASAPTSSSAASTRRAWPRST